MKSRKRRSPCYSANPSPASPNSCAMRNGPCHSVAATLIESCSGVLAMHPNLRGRRPRKPDRPPKTWLGRRRSHSLCSWQHQSSLTTADTQCPTDEEQNDQHLQCEWYDLRRLCEPRLGGDRTNPGRDGHSGKRKGWYGRRNQRPRAQNRRSASGPQGSGLRSGSQSLTSQSASWLWDDISFWNDDSKAEATVATVDSLSNGARRHSGVLDPMDSKREAPEPARGFVIGNVRWTNSLFLLLCV